MRQPGERWGKPVLPKEHGVWAILLVPLCLGAAVVGYSALQLLLITGAVLLYLVLAALLEAYRRREQEPAERFIRWAALYGLLALAAISLPLRARWELMLPGFAAGLALPVALYFIRRHQERALLNGAVSVAALSCGALATYVLGNGAIDARAGLLWLFCVLHFWGSLLFVRSMIRQRHNRRFAWLVLGYHALVAMALYLVALPLVALSFVAGLTRAVALAGRKLRPIVVGAVELVVSLVFFTLALLTLV